MNPCGRARRAIRRVLALMAAIAVVAAAPAEALGKPAGKSAKRPVKTQATGASKPKEVSPKRGGRAPKAAASRAKNASKGKHGHGTARAAGRRAAPPKVAPPKVRPGEPAQAELPGDLGIARQAIALIRQRKLSDASALAASLADPTARTLIEWALLRIPEGEASFERHAAFIAAHPDWPAMALLRRRAEARLWEERRGAATVRAFLAGGALSAKGRFALARALKDEDRATAERAVRDAWRSESLSADLEAAVLAAFPDVVTGADHRARMQRRIGAKDLGAAMRAARRVGDEAVAIVKACAGAKASAKAARKLFDAVPAGARGDLGYTLCRVQFLLRQDEVAAAAQAVLAAAREAMPSQDTDEWWRLRRFLARKLVDAGEYKTAYRVVGGAAPPANPYYRAEFHFMPGWIALRFLADPATAQAHFAHVDAGSASPVVRARAAYWRGRAHEAAGERGPMRTQYEEAARHATAYYGQLARARLGLGDPELRAPPDASRHVDGEIVRAAALLYAIGERPLALVFMTDLADQSADAGQLAALADLARRNDDARATLLIGKKALARGMPLDVYAFPDIGVPRYDAIGPDLDRSIVYSVARTESEFNHKDVSPANAVGLMQVTPAAGKDTARRLGIAYDWDRLVNDPVYNAQIGAAELAALLREYRGSFLMSFAGYNAGRSRVARWVAQFGDPRAAGTDAVDWVERIPFSETRNYVQRVMENLQVYRVRLGAAPAGIDVGPRSATAEESRTVTGAADAVVR